MSCSRHFLNFQWEHHSWHRRVSASAYVPTQETNMWGRVVNGESVRCNKQYVCEVCGKTRGDMNCVCDKAVGECCAVRRAWIDDSRQATK
mgnify:CR=1 FL=1